MKRFLASILALIYLSTSVGATVHLHYCMGKLMSWGLTNHESKNCRLCKLPQDAKNKICEAFKSGCCTDAQMQVKIEKDQKAVEFTSNFSKLSPVEVITDNTNTGSNSTSSVAVTYPKTNAPPSVNKIPAFIRNCVFRI